MKTSWKTKTTDWGRKVLPKRGGYNNVSSKVMRKYPLPFKTSVQSRFSRTSAEKVFQKHEEVKSYDKGSQIHNIFSNWSFSSKRVFNCLFCCFAVVIYSHSFSHKQQSDVTANHPVMKRMKNGDIKTPTKRVEPNTLFSCQGSVN